MLYLRKTSICLHCKVLAITRYVDHVQDPGSRPSAKQLMDFKFFREVKKQSALTRRSMVQSTLLHGLPKIVERVRQMRNGAGGRSVELVDEAETTSMERYRESISQGNWNWKFGTSTQALVRLACACNCNERCTWDLLFEARTMHWSQNPLVESSP